MSRRLLVLVVIAAAVVTAVAIHDVRAEREHEWTTRAAVSAIEAYRATVSPRLTGRVVCRFEPTCSVYGLESVRKHGAFAGGWKAVTRIARCNPWTPKGTVDPP